MQWTFLEKIGKMIYESEERNLKSKYRIEDRNIIKWKNEKIYTKLHFIARKIMSIVN